MQITINAVTSASASQCWAAATTADAITKWNTASPDWHCPSAQVDLQVGGRMSSRMEAVDGSQGFDFSATFTAIEEPSRLEYKLDDERMVELRIVATDDGTELTQVFDAESENDIEFQRAGWQSILDSFVKYVESQ